VEVRILLPESTTPGQLLPVVTPRSGTWRFIWRHRLPASDCSRLSTSHIGTQMSRTFPGLSRLEARGSPRIGLLARSMAQFRSANRRKIEAPEVQVRPTQARLGARARGINRPVGCERSSLLGTKQNKLAPILRLVFFADVCAMRTTRRDGTTRTKHKRFIFWP
jgi:hypothetical protein